MTRLDDGVIDHDKVDAAADLLGRQGYERVLGALTWGIVYANRRLTDGFLPQRAIEKYRISEHAVSSLVTVGLWTVTEGGYQIHDFHDWNPTAAQVKSKQSKDRERKRNAYFSARRDSGEGHGEPSGEAHGIHADSLARVCRAPAIVLARTGEEPSVDGSSGVEPEKGGQLVTARAAAAGLQTQRFETFWAAYPLHAKRKDAMKAFGRLNPDHVLLGVLLDAIERQKGSRQWREGFVPHAATWLNGERWKDELPVEPAAVLSGPTTRGERVTALNQQTAERLAARYRSGTTFDVQPELADGHAASGRPTLGSRSGTGDADGA